MGHVYGRQVYVLMNKNLWLLILSQIFAFTAGMSDTHALNVHLIESVDYFRYLLFGLGLLLIMIYRPKGILPDKIEIK